jgi:hypothetical protein
MKACQRDVKNAAEIISSLLSKFVVAVLVATIEGSRHSRMGVQGLGRPVSLLVSLPIGGWCARMHDHALPRRPVALYFLSFVGFCEPLRFHAIAQKGLEIRCSIRLSYGPTDEASIIQPIHEKAS